ncbi:MAG TPA: glycerol-3-phosphate 1-O-acyltransferase PlsY [Alphaproteobacteria bacterium]|nr:glycerol-3-phosphate 1-O-acyltransferase PlsY [Alphaproteobacteria bacterium]USO04874.1 MAG: glycerol-3-phosphate 1-O-acyltransferase PlsY [Rhodospirillales bacterium]HOO81420.1 glycerol-3-phosphate 1-O-acyltransferase PlsY [Alphaproteobacteria bacterium]
MMSELEIFLVPYLIGSIPFGFLLAKLAGYGDIRKTGSGNIGATNVLRTGNKFLAVFTLILDSAKGYIAALHFYLMVSLLFVIDNKPVPNTSDFSVEDSLLFGLFAILGHCFPVWLKFKGGKGVATTFGVLFAAVPWTGFIAAVTWGIVAGFSRYSSLSALSAVAISPLVTFIYYGPMPAAITALIAALVIWRHKDNIKRLMAGTEPKIGQKKEEKEQE